MSVRLTVAKAAFNSADRGSGEIAGTERAEKIISVCALFFAIELVFFKFLPDLSTALLQGRTSALAAFDQFRSDYFAVGSVHQARFLGNYILYGIARMVAAVDHSTDLRLHPLRIAAGILTACYAYLGMHFILRGRADLSWRRFFAGYACLVVIGLYVFYPADMPSFAFLSVGLLMLLEGNLPGAFLLMLITGLFRETAFHLVWFVMVWAWCDSSRPAATRLGWVAAFAVGFSLEYLAVRHFFPAPISSSGGITLDPRLLFLDRSLLSLTVFCSLGLAALFPIAAAIRLRDLPDDWTVRFLRLNCLVFPGWLLFYRMLSGNLAEFRILYPALLPCLYGIAWRARSCNRSVTALD